MLVVISSSAINFVEYEEPKKSVKTTNLDVHFTDGTSRRYMKVPKTVIEEFINAPSKGKYFNANIRDKYATGGVTS